MKLMTPGELRSVAVPLLGGPERELTMTEDAGPHSHSPETGRRKVPMSVFLLGSGIIVLGVMVLIHADRSLILLTVGWFAHLSLRNSFGERKAWKAQLRGADYGWPTSERSRAGAGAQGADRRCGVKWSRLLFAVLTGWFLLWVSAGIVVAGEQRQTGLFLVVAEASSAASLPTPTDEQRIVPYDSRFLREVEPTRYLLLAKKADVPLILAKTPDLLEKGAHGFPELHVELTPEAARSLEKLSREHLGGRVAFVIDDEPVTIHKIRSVISDGKLQITRCTDKACQYIYGRLTTTR